MTILSVAALLQRYGVRLTGPRRAVLEVLLQATYALSGAEIEQHLTLLLDRITLYRTLKTFEEKGLIHRVIDHSDTIRYAVCPGSSIREHVHFKCTTCQHIYCLGQVPVPTITLPSEYRVERGDYLLSGICERCHPS
ncbi:transcriptional repressor [Hymenobacter tibetensis]|uniref:Transcriptional repressor n=1 Tax=Hymenobacter tibetensis TaxID=497967 RepID=A0ABY4CVC6_9BACT|nr:transcriptional repressor [Hymenobacter tibetensis]UOG72959.1 transcriptional repressor [Hymenobacter tibetensis]